MSDDRVDTRDQDPQYTHRRVFIGGWTDAISGTLYQTVLTKKTMQTWEIYSGGSMGNNQWNSNLKHGIDTLVILWMNDHCCCMS